MDDRKFEKINKKIEFIFSFLKILKIFKFIKFKNNEVTTFL